MKLRVCSILFLFNIFLTLPGLTQVKVSGVVKDSLGVPIQHASVIGKHGEGTAITDSLGYFEMRINEREKVTFLIIAEGYKLQEKSITLNQTKFPVEITLKVSTQKLPEFYLEDQYSCNQRRTASDVEGTVIYAGKKNEIVLLNGVLGNIAVNQVRSIYAHVAGITMVESNDGGAQLSIGTRGLDPNRTANFNTRQNGYDISADALGYPESYYAPPAEALREIRIIRGAASLQYGPQFGGMINFIMKKPSTKKAFVTSRTTYGSFNLFTNFTSLSGTIGKFSYRTHINFKVGNGFRSNSEFNSQNAFASFSYNFNERSSLSLEYTFQRFLGKQPGGLTDAMFNQNPFQSNRSRNWFNVNWHLLALKFSHEFSPRSTLTAQVFGLLASRYALGFRSSKVSYTDVPGTARDLIKGDFRNWGSEVRFLHKYQLIRNENAFVVGFKYYQSYNAASQGPGTGGEDAYFCFDTLNFPTYHSQSDYTLPNLNFALFAEHIFRIKQKLTITPGARLEMIRTATDGYYRRINTDLAGNILLDETIFENRVNQRFFALFGLGLSYKYKPGLEVYGNISQNYRAVTFSDIRTINPSLVIDENIDDEKGFSSDLGLRGSLNQIFTYDVSGFLLYYDQKIGEYESAQHNGARFRGNIGTAITFGSEIYGLLNLQNLIPKMRNNWIWQIYLSTAVSDSRYIKSDIPNVQGNKVEFVPLLNLKSGLMFGYKDLKLGVNYLYMSSQFTDAQNRITNVNDNIYGIFGEIPAYQVLDISISYQWKMLKIEAGVNNTLNEHYFTRRATGYPGPGILPSAPRSFYLTLSFSR